MPMQGKIVSAWDMLCATVDAWRKAKPADRDAQVVVQARRTAETEEAQQIAERPMDPAEVERASTPPSRQTPGWYARTASTEHHRIDRSTPSRSRVSRSSVIVRSAAATIEVKC